MSKKPLTHLFSFCLAIFLTGGALAQEGPQLLSIPEHGQYCTDEDGLPLQATDLETEVTYQLQALGDNDWIGLQTFTLAAGESEYGFEDELFTEGEYRLFWTDEEDEGQWTELVTIEEKPLPALFSLINQSGDNCIPVQPGFNDSQTGVTYTLLRNGAALAEDTSEGGAFDFGTFQQPGHYAAQAGWTSGAQCLREMGGGFTADPLPLEVDISPADAFCAGQDIQLTFHGTEANTTYYIMLDGQEEQYFSSGAGGDVVLNLSFVQAGNYQVEAVNAHECLLVFEREIVIGPSPQQFSMLNAGDQCPGTEIALTACEEGVIYRLPPPLPLPGSKGGEEDVEGQEKSSEYLECSEGTLSFGPKNQSGRYRIEGIHQESGCKTWMHGETRIHPQPQLVQLFPNVDQACIGDVNLHLYPSQANVEYTLYRNEEEEVETLPGDQAGGMVTFGPVTEEGSYRVRATKMDGPGCSRWMNGEIQLYQPPMSYTMTANGEIPAHNTFCSSTAIEIGLNNAQAGVEYRLRRDGTSIATLTPVEPGPIQFGDLAPGSGLYTVTAHRAGCSTTMNGHIRLAAGPALYGLSASGDYFCEGDEESITLTLSNTQTQVLYSLWKDGEMVSGPVQGPGGAPLQWHEVSQYGAGSYNVRAVFPGDDSCPVSTESIEIDEVLFPEVTMESPEGNDITTCKGACFPLIFTFEANRMIRITYSNGEEDFTLELDPVMGTEQMVEVCPSQDRTYILKKVEYIEEPYCEVILENQEPVNVQVLSNPLAFSLTGIPASPLGSFCAPVTPVLDGSEAGVEYALFRSMEEEPLEVLFGGEDGQPLEFSPLSLGGSYYVLATNENACSKQMQGLLLVNALPELHSLEPAGRVCAHTNFQVGLDGTPQSDVIYTLLLDDEPYSDEHYLDGDLADQVVFEGLNQPGVYRIHAKRKTTGCQRMMQGSITARPAPQAFNLKPDDPGCSPRTIYINDSEDDVTYALWRTGAHEDHNIQIVEGTGDIVFFDPVSAAGNYFVIATNEDQCQRLMNDSVTVWALPEKYNITPGPGHHCVSDIMHIGLDHSALNKTYHLIRDGDIVQSKQGTGEAISFPDPTIQKGEYKIKAINDDTGCQSWMEGTIYLNPLPYQYAMTASQESPDLCLPIELGLENSQLDFQYFLVYPDDTEHVFTGTGEALSFGLVFLPGTYSVYARNPGTGCQVEMPNSQFVVQGPTYLPVSLVDDNPYFIEGDPTGNSICMPETEQGLSYQLVRDGVAIAGTVIDGHGGQVCWHNVGEYGPGHYQVVAISGNGDEQPECTVFMENGYDIIEIALPWAEIHGGQPVEVEICAAFNAELGIEFQGALPMHVYYTINDELQDVPVFIDPETESSPFIFSLPLLQENAVIRLVQVYYAYGPEPFGLVDIVENNEAIILVSPTPIHFLTPQVNVCGLLEVELSPMPENYTDFHWELVSGAGMLLNTDSLQPTYAPLEDDYSSPVAINLSLTGADACANHSFPFDTEIIYYQPPTISAGPDKHRCSNNTANIQLHGEYGESVSNVFWTGGMGTYTPDFHSATATYTPHPDEIAAGMVALTLHSDDPAGPCSSAHDSMTIHFHEEVHVDAGDDLHLCSDELPVQLSGQVWGGTDAGTWSGFQGYMSDISDLNSIYYPHPDEINEGLITLILTSHDPEGPCDSVSDTINIHISQEVQVDAGDDIHICTSELPVTLSGQVWGGASNGSWGAFDGEISDHTHMNATYWPSEQELANGQTTLILTSENPTGPCGAVTDSMTIFIYEEVFVDAGEDVYICASDLPIQLNGQVWGGIETGVWSGYDGSISNPTDLNAQYWPSEDEISLGWLELTLTSDDPAGPCTAADDRLMIYLDPTPVVYAGSNHVILGGASVQVYDAVAHIYSSLHWDISANALGTFEDHMLINPTYHSDSLDAGSTIFLTLEVIGEGNCNNFIFTDLAHIKVGGPVTADFEALEDRPVIMLCMGETAYFEDYSHISFPHADQQITRRTWDFGDGSPAYVSTDPHETLVTHVYANHGHYEVGMIVETGIEGVTIHSDTISQEIHIRDCHSHNLFMPNAIAPNDPNPGVRSFLPKGINLIEYKLNIYDKKGNLIWQTQELNEYDGSPKTAWDGTDMSGNPMPQGVYIYHVHARFRDGKVYGVSTSSDDRQYGTITLIR